MEEITVNYLAVIVSAVVSMFIGMLWYGPVFGKAWMASTGVSMADMKGTSPAKGIAISLIGAIIMAGVLAHLLGAYEVTSAKDGLVWGLWVWLGFVAPVMAATTYYDGRKCNYFLINAGFRLAELAVMGLILGAWI